MEKTLSFLTQILLYIIPAVTGTAATAADWPNLRGPNHNGISDEKLHLAELTKVRPLWHNSIGVGCSSVAVRRGRVYTMGNTGTKNDQQSHEDVVYCFDADTGVEIWRHTYKCGLNFKSNTPAGPFATPSLDANRVYTFSRKGDVFCLDSGTGKVVWHRDVKEELGMKMPFQGGFAGSPLILGEMVILNVGDAGTALDKHTGKVIWKSEAEDAAQATPVPFRMGDRQCIAIFSGFGVVGVDAADGRKVWSFPWDTKYKTNVVDPIIEGDKVFISTWYGVGCALLDISTSDPNVVWQNKEMQNHYSNCVLWKGYLYGFDVAKLKCMDFKTGRIKWALEGGFGRGSLMMADGKLIVLTEKGTLLIGEASPEGFTAVLKADIIKGKCYAGPVFCGGKIYARNDKGDLVCVALSGTDR
ncbi:MAG TPA: PQQ-binding-like beta-propeller repeat protein [Sedimentisphaerales bacterium]|nr:PQQ-binding-like beta-propeller repeat protein [Sedimentisphaerales bacterium]